LLPYLPQELCLVVKLGLGGGWWVVVVGGGARLGGMDPQAQRDEVDGKRENE
jgi:hypothetical protein